MLKQRTVVAPTLESHAKKLECVLAEINNQNEKIISCNTFPNTLYNQRHGKPYRTEICTVIISEITSEVK